MKANQKFVNADEAVSPVIAVILMVAITVVLAATVFVLVSDIGNKQTNIGPTATISASADSTNDDVLIKHVTGESMKSGEWKISVTTETAALQYCTGSAALDAGDTIRAVDILDGTGDVCSDAAVSSGSSASPSTGTAITVGKYHVVVVHIPSSKTMVDSIVEVL